MENQIKDLLQYYLTGKLNETVFQSEIERIYNFPSNVHCLIENSNTSTDTSFGVSVVPEYNGIALFATIVLDKILLRKLDEVKVELLIKAGLNYVQTALKHYYEFAMTHVDCEVGRTECIELDLSIQKDFINSLPDGVCMDVSGENGLFDMDKLDDVLLSITAQTESYDRIIEFVRLYHLLPVIALEKTELLFKKINKLDSEELEDGVFRPAYNTYYNDMIAYNPKSVSVAYQPTDNPRDLLNKE